MERVFQIVPAGSSIIAKTPYRLVKMNLKKIMALAMMALMVIPSLTITVWADNGDGADMVYAIERAQIYLEKVRATAVATAAKYEDPDHVIHGYLSELNDLLGEAWEEDTDFFFQEEGAGIADWSSTDAHSGTYSAYLSNGGSEAGAGRVVIPVNIPFSDITDLSYWFNYDFPDTVTSWHDFPYMVLELDTDDNDVKDTWIVLCSTRPEWRDYYEDPEAAMPAENEWVKWTLSEYDNWHDAPLKNVGSPAWDETPAPATLAEMQTYYSTAVVLNVKVAVGQWDYYGEPLDPVTAYVDDIEINGATYDFEEEYEGLGAEGLLAQASDYLDAGDIKSAARCLASARNILGRINGLLRSMAKAHKVARTEKFERKFQRRIQGIEDKMKRRKGPKDLK